MVQERAVLVEQQTIDKALDRIERIKRLEHSLERWRAMETDKLFPDEYDYFCQLLDYLHNGGAYTVRDVAAEIMQEAGRCIGRGSFWRKR